MDSAVFLEKVNGLIAAIWRLKPESLHEQVHHKYAQYVLADLQTILMNTDQLPAENLRKFFEENWELVKGNMLCYTACPESDVTLLLCGLATAVATELGISPIEVLMPGVKTEALLGDHPDLTNVDLKTVLRTHILSDDGKHLLPISCALEVDSLKSGKLLGSPYYETDYDHPVDPKELDPYAGFVNPRELHRMFEHNPDSRALRDALTQLDGLMYGEHYLLGQLNILLKYLTISSVAGAGESENAGQSGYAAISVFSEFYGKLTEDNKKRIPESLRKEIEFLLNLDSKRLLLSRFKYYQGLSSQQRKEKYSAAEREELEAGVKQHEEALRTFDPRVALVETCLNTRRQSLANTMSGQEALLSSIGLSVENLDTQIKAAKENVDAARKVLEKNLAQGETAGQDSLGLNQTLLDDLEVPFNLSNLAVLKDLLKRVSAEELKSLLAKEENQRAVIAVIESLENLILLNTEMPLHLFGTFYQCLANQLKETLLSQIRYVGMLLSVLSSEQQTLFIKNFVSCLVKSAVDFSNVLGFLSPEQRTVVYEALKDEIPGWVKSAVDFSNVLRFLSPEQRTVVYEALKDEIPGWVKSVVDFSTVLGFLSPEQRTVVYEALKDEIPGWVKSAVDFRDVLGFLSPEQRTVVYEALKDEIPGWVKSAVDFSNVLRFLSPEQRTVVYEALKDEIPGWVHSAENFRLVLMGLSPKQCTAVCEALKDNIPGWVNSAENFRLVLMGLSPEQCTAVCAALKNNISQWIKSASDFGSLLKGLSPEQYTPVCEALKDNVPGWIKSASDFGVVLKDFSPKRCKAVCEALKDKIPEWVKSASDFGDLLRELSPEQCTAVCEALKDKIPEWVKSASDFGDLLRELSPEQCTAVCEALKDNVLGWIKSAEDFRLVLAGLSPEQRTVVYEVLKNNIPQWIKSASDFGFVLRELSVEQCTAVCEALKDNVLGWIKSAEDFRLVLAGLSPKQCTAVCEVLKDSILQWIKSASDFRLVLAGLSPEQRTVVYEVLKNNIPQWIKSAIDFKGVLKYLSPKQCTAVCEVLKDNIPEWVRSAEDFRLVLAGLSPEQCTAVYKVLKDSIPGWVKSAKDFEDIVSYLSPAQKQEVRQNITLAFQREGVYINGNYLETGLARVEKYQRFREKTKLFGSTWQKQLVGVLAPIASSFARVRFCHWNTSGSGTSEIIDLCGKEGSPLTDIKTAIEKNLVDIDLVTNQKDPINSSFWPRPPTSNGETAMRLMRAWEIANDACRQNSENKPTVVRATPSSRPSSIRTV